MREAVIFHILKANFMPTLYQDELMSFKHVQTGQKKDVQLTQKDASSCVAAAPAAEERQQHKAQ